MYCASARICCFGQLTLERRHPAAAVRDLRDRPLQRRLRLIEVRADRPARSGVCEDVAAAAVGLEEQLRVVSSGAGRECDLGLRVRHHRRDVGRDRVRISAFDEILGHRRNGKVDLTANDLADRALVEPLAGRAREGFIQVRGRILPAASGLFQHVAAAALLLEEELALGEIGVLVSEPAGPAPGERDRGEREKPPPPPPLPPPPSPPSPFPPPTPPPPQEACPPVRPLAWCSRPRSSAQDYADGCVAEPIPESASSRFP